MKTLISCHEIKVSGIVQYCTCHELRTVYEFALLSLCVSDDDCDDDLDDHMFLCNAKARIIIII